MKFKEYYKRKLYEAAMTTDLTGSVDTQQQVSQEMPKGQITQTPYNISTQQQQSNNFRQTGGIIVPPIGMNPPDENWPPIPGNPLPTYVNPDGSQVWVHPGPPISIYVIRPNPSGNPPWIYEMMINQESSPGIHSMSNFNSPYGHWRWDGRRWQFSDWGTVPNGAPLRELWPGWHYPTHPPTRRKGQEGEWGDGGDWEAVPGYDNGYYPGYHPNYISPTNIPNQ